MKDIYLERDCKEFVLENDYLLNLCKHKTFLVTGATGLIGSHFIKSLLYANRTLDLDIRVIALVRNETKAYKIFEEYAEDIVFHVSDIRNQIDITMSIDYIVHAASVTSSKAFVDYPVDTILTAIEGTRNILELARTKSVKGFLYLSSLEIYGAFADKELIFEEDLGHIDFLNVRSSYSESKRMAECLCMSYSEQYKLPVYIARLTQTFGPGVTYDDNRVFAQFARSVIEKRDIVLHTLGQTKRNYCYTKDAISALLHILLLGQSSNAYNVATEDSYISIKEMAEMVIKYDMTNSIKVVFDLKEEKQLGYNPIVQIKLDSTKLTNLGWQPTTSLERAFESLINSMALHVENGK